MRKLLISGILAASTLAIAAPAAAQYAPAYGNQYGAPYGNAYGYNNYGQTRALMVRLNRIEQQINQLDRRNILSDREANRLRREANVLEQRLRMVSRNGLNGYEARDFQIRLARLEQHVRIEATDGNRWGYNNSGYIDRDRDGRDDRGEHQRWHDQHENDRHDDDDND